MRFACLTFATLLFACSFDSSGAGSETGETSEATEGSGTGSSGGEGGTMEGGTDPTTTTGDPTSTTGDPTSTTGDPTSTTGDPTSTTGDPTSTTGDPTSTTGDPTSTTGDSTTTTTGGDTCGPQPESGPYSMCFDTNECVDSDHCIGLQGQGGQVIDGHCTNFCDFAGQCPVPPGCDVLPVCQPLESLNGGAACLLDCTASQECPIGMECTEVSLGYDICM